MKNVPGIVIHVIVYYFNQIARTIKAERDKFIIIALKLAFIPGIIKGMKYISLVYPMFECRGMKFYIIFHLII